MERAANMRLLTREGEGEGRQDVDETDAMDRTLGGDRAAWDVLIQRHQHRVLVALLARGGRMDRAKELSQEAWARIIQQQQKGLLRELRMTWGPIDRVLVRDLRKDPPVREGCARYGRNEGLLVPTVLFAVCGDALLKRPPPAQLVLTFLANSFSPSGKLPERDDSFLPNESRRTPRDQAYQPGGPERSESRGAAVAPPKRL